MQSLQGTVQAAMMSLAFSASLSHFLKATVPRSGAPCLPAAVPRVTRLLLLLPPSWHGAVGEVCSGTGSS